MGNENIIKTDLEKIEKERMQNKVKRDFPELDDELVSIICDYYTKEKLYLKLPEYELSPEFYEKAHAKIEENRRLEAEAERLKKSVEEIG